MRSLKLIPLLLIIFFITSCNYTTPPEMLFGNWYIASVKANGHNMTSDYLDENTRYLVFDEKGTYQIGLLDTASEKSWLIHPDKNELVMMQGTPFDDTKTWKVKAADNLVFLNDKHNHFQIELKRKKELPKLEIMQEEALVGKWIIDKVTVNGYNNTDKYAFPNRWILLTDDGRFYNGNEKGDQNVGFWKANSSLTKLDFFDQKTKQNSFISFNIANNTIWYEKQREDRNQPQVRVYFKKSE